jgi:AcrR family transcriptional regulator
MTSPQVEQADEREAIARMRILDAAMGLLARYGRRDKLSMREVGEAAGVSRQTVYRYFPTKADLVDGLNGHELRRFEHALRAVVAGPDIGDDYLMLVLRFVSSYEQGHPYLKLLLETEPRFMIEWIRNTIPTYVRLMTEVLEPVLSTGERAGKRGGSGSNAAAIAEVVIYYSLGVFVFEHKRDPERLLNILVDLVMTWRDAAGRVRL